MTQILKVLFSASSFLSPRKTKTSKTIEDFFAHQKKVTYRSGEFIFRPEEKINDIIFIEKGFVRMYTISEDGDDLVLFIYNPGSLLPLMHMVVNQKNSYYFQVTTAVNGYKATRDEFLSFIKQDPEILYSLMQRFGNRITSLLYRIESQTFDPVSLRINNMLYQLCQQVPKNGGIELDLTHTDIASWLGVKRETVSRYMKHLQEAGTIESKRRKKVIVTNPQALVRV